MQPVLTNGEEHRWSVFVGGTEVNEYLMNFERAADLADDYLEDGYDDIYLMQQDTGEELRVD